MSVQHAQHLHAMHVVEGNHSHRNWRPNVTQEEESLHLFRANSGLIKCLVPHGRAS